MIKIEKGETNLITVTFTEMMQDSTNPILLVFINETTYEETEVLLTTNLSTSRGRYDLFEITETINPDENLQEVWFPSTGFWKYDAYEIDLSVSPREVVKKLETGRCNVTGIISEIDEVYR